MSLYQITIDFGNNLDLKGKIAASLLIRKMIEHMNNEYTTKVRQVQDTRCELQIEDGSGQDLSPALRNQLENMAGAQHCDIQITCNLSGGSAAPADGAPADLRQSHPTPAHSPASAPWWARRSLSPCARRLPV